MLACLALPVFAGSQEEAPRRHAPESIIKFAKQTEHYLAEQGAYVACLDINLDKAIATADSIRGLGGSSDAGHLDIVDANAVNSSLSNIYADHGSLDIVVCTPGVNVRKRLIEYTDEEIDLVLGVNLKGAFFCSRAARAALNDGDGGEIVMTSSVAGLAGTGSSIAYCASKAGLNALTEALMQEVRHDKIRVSCILPGSVDTEFAGNEPSPETSWRLTSSDVARAVLDLIHHPARSLPSRVELRPSTPRKK